MLEIRVSQPVCRDTLVSRYRIVGVSRETGVSQVCREEMVCRDQEEKKNSISRPMTMHHACVL